MPNKPPAISGKQLIRLLTLDGWELAGRRTHGVALVKRGDDGHIRTTLVPDKSDPLPDGTLASILGTKQTCIGRKGLLALIERYGLS